MFDADIAYHAEVRPRAPALLTPRRRATYRELNDDVNRFAAALRDLGVSRSSGVVAVETSQIYRAHVYMLALARLGVASGLAADGLVDLR
ncbi:MAG: AMP-binding protein, partial [Phenylobacterium sp.]